jgi:hypothetical protein
MLIVLVEIDERISDSKARPVASATLKVALYEIRVCPYVTIKDVTDRIVP